MKWFERRRVVVVRAEAMEDQQLVECFRGGTEQGAFRGMREVLRRLEDKLVSDGANVACPDEEKARLLTQVGIVREVEAQMLELAAVARKQSGADGSAK